MYIINNDIIVLTRNDNYCTDIVFGIALFVKYITKTHICSVWYML